MCIAVPARIVAISGKAADVEFNSSRRQVLLSVEGVKVDGWVLVYSGVAIAALTEEEALETKRLLSQLQAGK